MGLLSLIGSLPSLIGGLFGTINSITAAISNEKIAAITAKTQEEQIAANERVNALTQRRDVLIAEAGSGSRINLIVRAGFAVVIWCVIAKLYLWDKVIGSFVGCSQAPPGTCGIFTTDPLDENAWKIIGMVLAFYFVSEVTLGVTRIIRK